MPAVTPAHLIDAILDAIQQSGGVGLITSALRSHPRKFAITRSDGTTLDLWVYAWTLTFGGRPSLPDEYRIQMTSVKSPLALNPTGATILLGYEPNIQTFAGFDLNVHRKFTTGSPSVQIDITVLKDALTHGLSFHRKSNQEIAVAIRPDNFLTYVDNAVAFHNYGRHRSFRELMTKASTLAKIAPADLKGLTVKRRTVIETVRRASRDANFRQQILNAYGNRCAVTRLQLKLVEAAHILPVAAPNSPDHILNGIALSPTYHRAYDAGLIFLDDSYAMRINKDRERELRSLKLDGGLPDFKAKLGKIHLPPNKSWWPDVRFIRKANRYRRISAA